VVEKRAFELFAKALFRAGTTSSWMVGSELTRKPERSYCVVARRSEGPGRERMGSLLYLSRGDVEKVALPMEEIIRALEAAFLDKARGLAEAPPKPGVHPRRECFLHAMPASLPQRGAVGIKWVAGYPTNPKRGLPYISGLVILNDPETGLPISVMDCTWITAKRTAAASALAAKFLARRDARVLGICGCGVQGRTHLEALKVVLPSLEEVLLYDVSPEAARLFVEEMAPRYPELKFQKVSSAYEAVGESDIIVTAALILREAEPVIRKGWVRPGAFASAVDFDCYWTREALEEMDLIITDDEEQLSYYRSSGYFPRLPRVDGELGEIISGAIPGREDEKQRTMAVFLGLAIEDMVTALAILERARRMGLGTELPL